ncbi:hypothetical protein IWW50_001441 [Coemansia erecta]|nr:hypothetical protein IWW50_001441 [Coemansia erecta]
MAEKTANTEPVPQDESSPPAYDEGLRGLGTSFSSQQPPPPPSFQQQQPYPPLNSNGGYPPQPQQQLHSDGYPFQQQQQFYGSAYEPPPLAPIHLPLVNPQRILSGFSLAIPERMHALARHPIDASKWTQFVQELNDELRKAPGSLAKNVANFWLANLVTLGIASHAFDFFKDRVINHAMEVVEKHNRVEFARCGIHVQLVVIRGADDEAGSSSNGNQMRGEGSLESECRQGGAGISTLELVVTRA